jgi:hypothetical protein
MDMKENGHKRKRKCWKKVMKEKGRDKKNLMKEMGKEKMKSM